VAIVARTIEASIVFIVTRRVQELRVVVKVLKIAAVDFKQARDVHGRAQVLQ
jgi:hypothetical protein